MIDLVRAHADELRETWQSKALRASSGKMRKVIITVLAKEYPAALLTLMKVTFPGFEDIDRPIFTSYAEVALSGRLVCDMIDGAGIKQKVAVYRHERLFIYDMRKLADKLKLPDAERIEMFRVLQKWVARDNRVGAYGQKLAS